MTTPRKDPPKFDGKLEDLKDLSKLNVLLGCCDQGGCCVVPETQDVTTSKPVKDNPIKNEESSPPPRKSRP